MHHYQTSATYRISESLHPALQGPLTCLTLLGEHLARLHQNQRKSALRPFLSLYKFRSALSKARTVLRCLKDPVGVLSKRRSCKSARLCILRSNHSFGSARFKFSHHVDKPYLDQSSASSRSVSRGLRATGYGYGSRGFRVMA